jgi:hypothetical protein
MYSVLVFLEVGRKGGYHSTNFFSRGDFRPDVVDIVDDIIERNNKYAPRFDKYFLPRNWKKAVLDMKGKKLKIANGDVGALQINALDFKRIAEIARDGYVKDPNIDENGNQILTREDFLIEFRGSLADQLLNSGRFGLLPPSDGRLTKILKDAGEVFDLYMSIPVGTMMVTKDFYFPYRFARKVSEVFKWPDGKGAGISKKGSMTSTSDPCASITGVDKNCAPHIYKNPVLRASFTFPMCFIRDTYTIRRDEEARYIKDSINSLKEFNTIWVQGTPRDLPQGITPIERGNWYPTKEELILIMNKTLGIN